MNLKGQTAMVTGGGSGLGAAVAENFAAAGATVVVVDIDKSATDSVARRIGGTAIALDVTDASAAEAAIKQSGPLRVLVNCAGIGVAGRVVGREGPMPLPDFEKVIRVNLIGSFNMIRLAGAAMQTLDPLGAERGVIVSTASVAAYEGQIGQAAYAASKGGIVSMTLPIAREFARFGIRVNTVAPGLFRTPLLGTLPEEAQQSLASAIPFPPRLGEASEFAALVRHIVENEYLNGETIRLDGALRMAPK